MATTKTRIEEIIKELIATNKASRIIATKEYLTEEKLVALREMCLKMCNANASFLLSLSIVTPYSLKISLCESMLYPC